MEGAPGREYLSTFTRPSLNRPWKRTAVQAVNITAIHRLYWQAFAVIALGSARIYTATAERLIYQAEKAALSVQLHRVRKPLKTRVVIIEVGLMLIWHT